MGVLAKEIEATYEVLSKMGEGGMGAVYKVRHRFFDEVRVIKVMTAEIETVDELKERFLGEAKRGKQLRHPNLAEVIDFSVAADGTSYMVMEYIEGVNLRELMTRNNGPLDHRALIPIAEQALSALGYLHSKNFVHRDISPDNIMLTSDPTATEPHVKLIDLGIAKSLEANAQKLTMVGKFIGKVQYASPEQFSGRVDGRSDLYSLGVVLYELLTGAKPITGKDYFQILGGHVSRPPRPFEETDPGNIVPPAVRRVILKALEKRPEDRFQTAEEFAQALRETLEVPAVTEVMTIAAPVPAKTSLPRWYPAAAIVALVLLGVLGTIWWKSTRVVVPIAPAPAPVRVAAPVASTTTVEVPVPAVIEEPPGQLLINALPWAQVTSVKNDQGVEQLTGAAETPLLLALPPGSYKVALANPNSNRAVVLDGVVTANAMSRVEAELDRVDINRYIDAIGIGR
ncbi:MAG: serine/threonine protein kinase [Thermoanaerobaculia bacterium]